jgi:Phytanoyl-CoA dioxygenase (PhyH)
MPTRMEFLPKIKHKLKLLKIPVYLVKLFIGIFIFYKRGITPAYAYQSLITLYCSTNGYSNDFLAWIIKLYRPVYKFSNITGVLGDLNAEDLEKIADNLNRDGYYIFENLLPPEICDKLKTFALQSESIPSPFQDVDKTVIYDRQNPIATTYRFQEQDLVNQPDIKKLISDLSFIAIAQAYLQSQPILDIVTMWWSTAFSRVACSESAQLYHFDMDRIKWIKFFIYLTDVNTYNGPHCYIKGTHKSRSKPRKLLEYGYDRITDTEIEKLYPPEKRIEITGKKGLIIAGDTKCFHKGKELQMGDRLVLELEFSNSLFGGAFEIKSSLLDLESNKFFKNYRRLYSKFNIE